MGDGKTSETTITRKQVDENPPTIFDRRATGEANVFRRLKTGGRAWVGRLPVQEVDYPVILETWGPGKYILAKVETRRGGRPSPDVEIDVEGPEDEETAKGTAQGGGAGVLLLGLQQQIKSLQEHIHNRPGPEQEYRAALKLQREESERSSRWLTEFFEGQRERDKSSQETMFQLLERSSEITREAMEQSNRFALKTLRGQLDDAKAASKDNSADPLEMVDKLLRLKDALGDMMGGEGDGAGWAKAFAPYLPALLASLTPQGPQHGPPTQLPSPTPEQDAAMLTGQPVPVRQNPAELDAIPAVEDLDQADDDDDDPDLAVLDFWLRRMKRLPMEHWGDLIRAEYEKKLLPPVLVPALEKAWRHREIDELIELFDDIDEADTLRAFLLLEAQKAASDAQDRENTALGSDGSSSGSVELDASRMEDPGGPREDRDPAPDD